MPIEGTCSFLAFCFSRHSIFLLCNQNKLVLKRRLHFTGSLAKKHIYRIILLKMDGNNAQEQVQHICQLITQSRFDEAADALSSLYADEILYSSDSTSTLVSIDVSPLPTQRIPYKFVSRVNFYSMRKFYRVSSVLSMHFS